MNDAQQLKYLRIALIAVGIIFIVGIYLLMVVWPSGWTWHTGHSHYPMMIVGIYATLGVFLLMAARNPLNHLSLIWFTVWSSVVHGGIMTVQSFANAENHGHLVGDVPALFIVATILAILTPRNKKIASMQRTLQSNGGALQRGFIARKAPCSRILSRAYFTNGYATQSIAPRINLSIFRIIFKDGCWNTPKLQQRNAAEV